jgi:hypothetical protein
VLLLFATKGTALRNHVTSKCRFHALVDIGPHASPIYGDSERLHDSSPAAGYRLTTLTHQLLWRNRHFVKVAKPFADLLRAYSPLGTGSDVPLRPARNAQQPQDAKSTPHRETIFRSPLLICISQ